MATNKFTKTATVKAYDDPISADELSYRKDGDRYSGPIIGRITPASLAKVGLSIVNGDNGEIAFRLNAAEPMGPVLTPEFIQGAHDIGLNDWQIDEMTEGVIRKFYGHVIVKSIVS